VNKKADHAEDTGQVEQERSYIKAGFIEKNEITDETK
jgi:hypothetical protein